MAHASEGQWPFEITDFGAHRHAAEGVELLDREERAGLDEVDAQLLQVAADVLGRDLRLGKPFL